MDNARKVRQLIHQPSFYDFLSVSLASLSTVILLVRANSKQAESQAPQKDLFIVMLNTRFGQRTTNLIKRRKISLDTEKLFEKNNLK